MSTRSYLLDSRGRRDLVRKNGRPGVDPNTAEGLGERKGLTLGNLPSQKLAGPWGYTTSEEGVGRGELYQKKGVQPPFGRRGVGRILRVNVDCRLKEKDFSGL